MTKQEAVIIETYTGICMLTGEDRGLSYKYAEKILGHPILTHEFPKYADELKEKSKPDFINLCRSIKEDTDKIVIDGKEIKDFPRGKKNYTVAVDEKRFIRQRLRIQKRNLETHTSGVVAFVVLNRLE